MRSPTFEEKVELSATVANETGQYLADAATQVKHACIVVFEPHERATGGDGLLLVAWEGRADRYEAYTWEGTNLVPQSQAWQQDHLVRQAKSILSDLIYGGPIKEAIITAQMRDRIVELLKVMG